ncbi:hypothetical protein H4R33_005820 [Dimargaris cristalligena]|nr:hypothetical protein H4R33_005820 [Dimargaris cristalligena]
MMSPGPDHTAELTLGSTDVGSAESDPTWTPGASRYLLISYTGGSQGSDKVLNTLEASALWTGHNDAQFTMRVHHVSHRAAKSYCKGDCQFSGLALDTWIVDSEIATVNLKVQFDDCRWSKNLLLQLDHFLSTSGQSKAHVTLCTQDEALWLTLYRRLPTDTVLQKYLGLPSDCTHLLVEETVGKGRAKGYTNHYRPESYDPWAGGSLASQIWQTRTKDSLHRPPIENQGSMMSGNLPSLQYSPKSISSSPTMAGRNSPEYPVVSYNRNFIDYGQILAGEDTRSTFMIRNIPNKYTQLTRKPHVLVVYLIPKKMMIDLVNESHYRKFDFFYLRMDFINHCNCGYAFINFIDPKSVVPFAKRLVGRKWEKFNSDKVCSIRYADYQGKDRLVEHFRNSK